MKKSITQIMLSILVLLISISISAQEKENKVLIIGWDGVRSDCLELANTPNMDNLFSQGISTTWAHNQNVTVSGPTWSTILTGVWQIKHGVSNNSYTNSQFNTYPYFPTRAKSENSDLYCVHICSWSPMTENVYNHGFDNMIVPTFGDEYCSLAAQAQLANPDLDVLFVHFDQPDGAGHQYMFSPTASGYIDAIENCDYWTGQLLQALYSRPTYDQENWLIISMTDHGGIGFSHGGVTVDETRVWISFANPRFPNLDIPGIGGSHASDTLPMLVDIAVTALDHLDIDIKSEWDLDGRSMYDLYESHLLNNIDSKEVSNLINIYPNPANDILFVESNLTEVKNSNIQIMDISGKIIKSIITDKRETNIDVSDISEGLYLLKFDNGKQVKTKKIQIVK
ncbi:MAG: alkaline phosphatase family protein [Bacteroidales bacterium]|nr:alkaline phosphatase family protein [Bacteroidales bacterium]